MLGSREPEIIRSFTRVWIGASASKTSVVSVGATRPLTRMASPTSPPRLTRETIRRGLPSRLPSFVDPQPRVFTVDEGPAPGLLDSDTAYEIAEAGGRGDSTQHNRRPIGIGGIDDEASRISAA